ncbi:MAG: lysylphosphatidylglycerol synthase transmembrane domain-containing protein [Polyangia bacterium]
MTEATRRRLGTLGRVLAPIVLVAVVWRFVDLGSVAARLHHIDAVWAVIALLVTLPLYALYALRWSFTAGRVGAPLSFRKAFAEYYVSTLLNQLSPLGVAGDVVRALRHHGRLHRDGATSLGPSARAVLLERMSGLVGLALFVLVSAGAWIRSGRRELVPVAVGALGLVVAGALFAVRRLRAVDGTGSAAAGRPGLARFVRDGRAALVERGALGVQLALSGAAVALLVVLFVCAARATGVVVDPLTALAVVPLVLAATIVPFAFAGWGVREATTAALYGLLGLDAATGVAVSVAFGLVNLAAASPGLLVLALSGAPRSRA